MVSTLAKLLPRSLLTKEAALHIKAAWMDDCLLSHDICSSRLEDIPFDELPARLVEIHMVDSQPKARIVSARRPGFRHGLKYLALSHAWGSCDFIVLRKDNIERFYQELPLDDISFNKTFVEAITMTALLGYQYIWIDSLCIIQDSDFAADWAAECPLMGGIYANSDLTLSATGFANPLDGMQAGDNRQTILPPVIKTPDGKQYLVIAYEAAQCHCPLEKRGWVLQEALLVSGPFLKFT